MKKITMSEIARRLGLSQPYVSKIIHGKEPNASKETVDRVLKMVDELGYVPDYAASTLRSGKRMMIGVGGTGDLESINHVSGTHIYSGIGRVVDEREYYMTFFPLTRELVNTLLRIARTRMVDGLIFVIPSFLHDVVNTVKIPIVHREQMPVVVIHYDTLAYDCHSVGYDQAAAGKAAVEYLAGKGISDIALVNNRRDGRDAFYEGYEKAAGRARLQVRDLRFTDKTPLTAASGYRLGTELVKKGNVPAGLVVHNDLTARGMVTAFREHGLRLPDDTAVVACGGTENDTRSRVPDLTTVEMPLKEMGAEAARMLFIEIDRKTPSMKYKRKIFKPRLTIRNTA